MLLLVNFAVQVFDCFPNRHACMLHASLSDKGWQSTFLKYLACIQKQQEPVYAVIRFFQSLAQLSKLDGFQLLV